MSYLKNKAGISNEAEIARLNQEVQNIKERFDLEGRALDEVAGNQARDRQNATVVFKEYDKQVDKFHKDIWKLYDNSDLHTKRINNANALIDNVVKTIISNMQTVDNKVKDIYITGLVMSVILGVVIAWLAIR